MKRIIKGALRGVWRIMTPLHRPITSRFHAFLRRTVVDALADPASHFKAALEVDPASHIRAALQDEARHGEIGRTLDAVIQELIRLQLQVEAIDARWQMACTRADGTIPLDPALGADNSSAHFARSLAS